MSTLVLKALHCVKNAHYFLNYLATQERMSNKCRVRKYCKSLRFIIDDILSHISDADVREEFRQQIKSADSVAFESIFDKLLYLTDEQRGTIETLLEAMIHGETIEVEEV